MFKPNSVILYVNDVDASTTFYASIFGEGPIEAFPGFSVFSLKDGFILGLQTKHDIEPKPEPAFGGFELCLSDISIEEVDAIYNDFASRNVPMALTPTRLEFGYTFVALDPDGHRIRLCATDTSGIEKL
ncbi:MULTISPECIES: VOC family protein [Pectobacterium]|uniref:Phenazine antibiotic resistance protein n=3 Tax=Pectobacterium TaxID=122277 RepID=A0A1V2R5C1_9GAMM|nr:MULTISPECIES: VOC family protein [Pectobacterium]KFX22582.1 phenazine biosynthesis protein [Pectobacterium betavasculorum]KGA34478.1 phenazine biosynthesis protein [Pectobacterium brasiliense]KHN91598.1 EhpR protein [Pectobacterium actinidiae]KMK83074.1 putative phenazine antibiotic biosynthesis protein [Pectobacterium brasiliense ICMP 19477]MBN3190057.1 VOC family protein [Pectobacterium brasiliense]